MRCIVTAFVLFLLASCQNASHGLEVTYPDNAPRIVSDFHSLIGVNRKRRESKHQGIDLTGPSGQAVIAAADGVVLETATEKCWGPTVVVDHGEGPDGQPLIALYGHVDEILVEAGQEVERGDLLARLGDNHRRFRCIYGVRHLHFQLGRRHRTFKGSYWGYLYFLEDGARGVNPHRYWADGPGKVTCFEPQRVYPEGTLTYPVPCREQ